AFFLADISAVPVFGYSNIYSTSATGYALNFKPTTVNQPPFRNLKEDINVKELIETLQETFRQSKTPVPVAKTTNLPIVNSRLYDTKFESNEDSSQYLVTELAILDTAYSKVSDHLELVHNALKKNFDVMMKLNILKGMLMEESIRSKGSRPWIEYISNYKNVNQR
ncbi:uncharacterized protein LOC112685522, partial [Sipha flava]|uniref:Uncharacterized protein LOC112685522 n=1 Tax=Sipha flava TaxID=143950 RepID=A0A8B8FRX0_9HEMI